MVFLVILSILTGFWQILGPRLCKPVTNGGNMLLSALQSISNAGGKTLAINRDSSGGGWFDQTELRTIYADKHSTIVLTDLNARDAEIHQSTTTVSSDGLTHSVASDLESNAVADPINTYVLINNTDGTRVEITTDKGNNESVLAKMIATNDNAPPKAKAIAA